MVKGGRARTEQFRVTRRTKRGPRLCNGLIRATPLSEAPRSTASACACLRRPHPRGYCERRDRPQAHAPPPHALRYHVRDGRKRTRDGRKLTRIGGVMTKGFLPCDDGLVKATKLNQGLPHPNKRSGAAAGLPGSCEWHVQSSGSLPPAAPQFYRHGLCRSMPQMNLG